MGGVAQQGCWLAGKAERIRQLGKGPAVQGEGGRWLRTSRLPLLEDVHEGCSSLWAKVRHNNVGEVSRRDGEGFDKGIGELIIREAEEGRSSRAPRDVAVLGGPAGQAVLNLVHLGGDARAGGLGIERGSY